MAISQDPSALISELNDIFPAFNRIADIFGPGVNLAARMESFSDPTHITISEETYKLLGPDFVCSEKGEFEVKGFGEVLLYDLEGEIAHGR